MKKRKTLSEFIARANEVHNNKYEYTNTIYTNMKTKLSIICPEHGEFFQIAYDHLKGCGCKQCRKDKLSIAQRKPLSKFIAECSQVHGNKYDYTKVEYINASTNIRIICPEHGEFEQQPQHHKNGSGCPACNSSKGECAISKWLESHNISFVPQKTFPTCKNKRLLPFDFYLPEFNTCIEFDGLQHFISLPYFNGDDGLSQRIKHDTIKTNYCSQENIRLIRIRYNQSVEEILSKSNIIPNMHLFQSV